MENKKTTIGSGRSPLGFWWISALIVLAIFGIEYFYSSDSAPKEISQKEFFSEVLPSGSVKEVVIFNKDYAKVFLTPEALKSDKYKDLVKGFGMDRAKGPHMKVIFVSADNFEKTFNEVIENSNLDVKLGKEVPNTMFGDLLTWMLPILIMVGLFIFMMRRMGGGAGGGGNQIFNIGKSKARVFDENDRIKVTFENVAGLEGAKEELQEIVNFLREPSKYTRLGGKIPKGALLVGPPGTGKTLLAKAIAGEASVPFFSLSGSDFVEMFVGVGASRVRDLFKQAKEKSPAIIFIDEIDAIGRARGKNAMTGSNDERENTLNQLLTEMDGFQTDTNVIVLAATNRADILDKALLRAGRFDRQIYVDLPDLNEREAIFKVHLKPLKLAKNLDISFLARQTPGFSGADIANVCNEAALIAARRNKDAVDKEDFLSAVDRIVGGLEKRTRIISPAEKRAIAFHEAGHATVSWLVEHAAPLVKVTIVPRGQSLGAAWYLPEERQITTAEQIKDEMCATLGGRAAEKIIFDKISTGALSDLEKVSRQATAMVTIYGLNDKLGNITYYDSTGQRDYGFTKPYSEKTAQVIDEEISKLIEEQYERAIEILSANRDKLTRLAEILLEKEVIFKEDLVEIFGPRPFGDDENTAPADDTKEGDASESNGADDTSSDTGDANGGERPSDTKAVV
ncbi:MAG: ATP-dependent zinc metalloprotease FtsH [Flavobacteriales bacterium]|nr:ATP-dependent zinc metalloprotease FtsH [Flavobacteriales bacterium]